MRVLLLFILTSINTTKVSIVEYYILYHLSSILDMLFALIDEK